MSDHTDCARLLRSMMADKGIEITVSICRPLVAGPYTADPFVCPHGTWFWLEPTGDQIAEWVRDGVE